MANYPERYWHFCVTYLPTSSPKGHRQVFAFNLDFQQVESVLSCWRAEKPFLISGVQITKGQILGIQLVHTSETSKEVTEKNQQEFLPEYAVFARGIGTDYGQELLYSSTVKVAKPNDLDLVLQLVTRLPETMRVLSDRRAGRPNFAIKQEFDVQDLLHAVISAYYKNTISEEPLGKLVGGSSRTDLALEESGILIEIKYARKKGDQQKLFDEFTRDQNLYTKWEPLKHFIYVIYNSKVLKDPEAFDKLNGTSTILGRTFDTHIVRI